ncbi:uracil phosphoribosyltransferase [Glomus cerebriforme]|uniref:uracil phosphoribosyltransferase n=1 Tax=Glomus cerebriforme TaxID=658196 RepID=A0A397TJA0_9GLOM|nr:uracil phosphoribosyltransferase [Glomus cerebriforme]
MSYVHASSHPLVAHKISILRNKNTKSKQVRELMHEIGQLLAYEATADLPLKSAELQQSPMGSYSSVELAPKIGLVPILRSGISFVNALQELLPTARILHLGIFREKTSLQPVEYYNKLPSEPNVDQIIVLEPMIATGGTAIAAVSILKDWGIKTKIKFITVVASRQGLGNLHKKHPDVEVFVGVIDEILDDHGYIVPGLGDAGDRLHDTPSA